MSAPAGACSSCVGMTMAIAGTWCPLPRLTLLLLFPFMLLSSPLLLGLCTFPLESLAFFWWRNFPPLELLLLFMRFLPDAGDWRGAGRSSSKPRVEDDSDSLPGKASLFIVEGRRKRRVYALYKSLPTGGERERGKGNGEKIEGKKIFVLIFCNYFFHFFHFF